MIDPKDVEAVREALQYSLESPSNKSMMMQVNAQNAFDRILKSCAVLKKTQLSQSDEDASSSVERLNNGSVINPASGAPFPPGWKLMPQVPTEEMLKAVVGSDDIGLYGRSLSGLQIDYQIMYMNAPTLPTANAASEPSYNLLAGDRKVKKRLL